MIRLAALILALMLAAGPASAETRPFVKGSWPPLLQAHAGRPLVVHFWSLTCAPCLAELPQWRELRRRHPEMDLVMIATDPIEDAPRLERTLARAGLAGVEGWAFADGFAERLRFEIDRTWQGELPMTRLIGRGGDAETVIGPLPPSVLAQWLGRQSGRQP